MANYVNSWVSILSLTITNIALASAFVSKGSDKNSSFMNLFGQARYAAYYLIFKKKRIEQFNMFMSNPDIDL